jgi:hypothetical protein
MREDQGVTLSSAGGHTEPRKTSRGSGRARPWRRPGRSQDRHQHFSERQVVTRGARLLHDEAYLTSGVTPVRRHTWPLEEEYMSGFG